MEERSKLPSCHVPHTVHQQLHQHARGREWAGPQIHNLWGVKIQESAANIPKIYKETSYQEPVAWIQIIQH